MTEEPPLGIHRTPSASMPSAGESTRSATARWSTRMEGRSGHGDRTQVGPTTEPTLRDLSEALIAVCGTDYGIHSPTWISRFTDMTRQAASYRDRTGAAGRRRRTRASPDGGQGLNRCAGCGESGMEAGPGGQGTSPESLLDTYHAERHPVAARVLRNTMAQSRFAARTNARRPCATPWPSSSAWTSRANDSPR
jgi:3-(3-hydroxy-phenyl)propionate hydroxylase